MVVLHSVKHHHILLHIKHVHDHTHSYMFLITYKEVLIFYFFYSVFSDWARSGANEI